MTQECGRREHNARTLAPRPWRSRPVHPEPCGATKVCKDMCACAYTWRLLVACSVHVMTKLDKLWGFTMRVKETSSLAKSRHKQWKLHAAAERLASSCFHLTSAPHLVCCARKFAHVEATANWLTHAPFSATVFFFCTWVDRMRTNQYGYMHDPVNSSTILSNYLECQHHKTRHKYN